MDTRGVIFSAVFVAAISSACSSSNDGGGTGPASTGTGGLAGAGKSSGTGGGSSAAGGSSGTGGGSSAVKMYCELHTDSCMCIEDEEQALGDTAAPGTCPPSTYSSPPTMCCSNEATGICLCYDYKCGEAANMCMCSRFGANSGTQTKCLRTWSICCASASGTCACNNIQSECDTATGERQVPNCDPQNWGCEDDTTRVATCVP